MIRLFLIILLLTPFLVNAADVKITELAEDTTLGSTDLIMTVDMGSTPTNKKVTLGNLLLFFATQDWTMSGTWTGNIVGNASTATALAANPTDCSANQFANAIAASGNLTCAALTDADVPNDITITKLTLADASTITPPAAAPLSTSYMKCETVGTCTWDTGVIALTLDAITDLLLPTAITDEQLICADNTTEVITLKSCGAKNAYTEPASNVPICRTGSNATGECTSASTGTFGTTAIGVGTGTSLALSSSLSGMMLETAGYTPTVLSAANVAGTTIYNTGQTVDTYLTLPTAAAGMNALFTVGTAVAKYWGVCTNPSVTDKIYLIASAGTVTAGADDGCVRLAAAQIGQAFACWTFKTDAYDWMCKAISIGTSTFAVP